MSFTVDGQSFSSIPVVTLPDKTSPAPIIKEDLLETHDYCPYCEIFFGLRIRPSGNPYGENRFVVVANQDIYPVCHLHNSRGTTGKVKELPFKASA